jgi:hypothetical protein
VTVPCARPPRRIRATGPRKTIWDSGPYAGYPDDPDLQLTWFLDQALAVRQMHVAAGETTYGQDPGGYGEWAADVERPAEQYRYRYQLHLDEARGLIGPDCAGLPTTPPPPPPSPPPPAPPADIAIFSGSPKSLRISGSGRFTFQFAATPGRAGKIALTSTKRIRFGTRKRKLKLAAKSFTAQANGDARVKFKLSASKLRALKRAHSVRLAVSVTVGTSTFAAKLKLKAPKHPA